MENKILNNEIKIDSIKKEILQFKNLVTPSKSNKSKLINKDNLINDLENSKNIIMFLIQKR